MRRLPLPFHPLQGCEPGARQHPVGSEGNPEQEVEDRRKAPPPSLQSPQEAPGHRHHQGVGHRSPPPHELARQAVNEGADYIAFGRFFPSVTKPNAVQAHTDILQQAQQLQRPIVAIGGISQDNAPGLINAGADMIAVIDAIFGQGDIKTATQHFQNLFTSEG